MTTLNKTFRETICTIYVPECGSESGQIMLVTKALYHLKSSGAAFRELLDDSLYDMGYKYVLSDPDAWIIPGLTNNGNSYYEYGLLYAEEILSI